MASDMKILKQICACIFVSYTKHGEIVQTSAQELMNKKNKISFSNLKKNEMLIYASTQRHFENTRLSKRNGSYVQKRQVCRCDEWINSCLCLSRVTGRNYLTA